MYRFLFFMVSVIIPAIFGWWLFLPLAFLSVYLSKLPLELLLAGFILDSTYYFGGGIFLKFPLTLFSAVLLFLALFLSTRLHWRKVI